MKHLGQLLSTAEAHVKLLYHSLSEGDGTGPSTTAVTAVVELPPSTNQETEQLVLDSFSSISVIEGLNVTGGPVVYILKPAGEPIWIAEHCICDKAQHQ